MGKIIDCFINLQYLKTLHQYDSIKNFDNVIRRIILFHEDKIICLSEAILIYNISNKKLLCKIDIPYKRNKYYTNIKPFGKDTFIIFNWKEFKDNNIILYKYIENKEENKYSCIQITKVLEKSINILINEIKMFCIRKGILKIYNFINNTHFELQAKIKIPKLMGRYSFHKGFLKNNKYLNIVEYKDKLIQLWTFKKYKLVYKDKITIDTGIIENKLLIESFNKDDIIFFAYKVFVYLYSYKNKQIINKIIINSNNIYKSQIQGIFFIRDEKMFVNDKNNIYYLDIKNRKSYKLIRNKNKFENVAIGFDKIKGIFFITNSSYEIKFFKSSIFRTILQDLKYYLFTSLFIFFLKLFGSDKKILLYKDMISSLIVTIPVFLYYKKMNFYSTIEDIIKEGEFILLVLSILSFIIINKLIKNAFKI